MSILLPTTRDRETVRREFFNIMKSCAHQGSWNEMIEVTTLTFVYGYIDHNEFTEALRKVERIRKEH